MDVSSKILRGSCTDVPDSTKFLLQDDNTGSMWLLLIVESWVVGIAFYLRTFSLPFFPLLMVY